MEFNLKSSSLVKEIFYDETNHYLLVRLTNTFYHYCNIPESVVRDWFNASSPGSCYDTVVRGNYSCLYVIGFIHGGIFTADNVDYQIPCKEIQLRMVFQRN